MAACLGVNGGSARTAMAVLACFAGCASLFVPGGAAQDRPAREAPDRAEVARPARPRTAVVPTVISASVLEDFAPAVERLVRSELTALAVADVESTPPLALADLQLAVGCIGETAACLGKVADQLEVDALVIPKVDGVDGTRIVSVTLFDVRAGRSRTATRRATGERAESDALNHVPALLRELYGLPDAPPRAPSAEGDEPSRRQDDGERPEAVAPGTGHGGSLNPSPGLAETDQGATGGELEDTSGSAMSPLRVAAFVGGALSLGALGAGIGFGLASTGTEDDYAKAPTQSMNEVDAALALKSDAEQQATLANAFLIGGAVLGVASAVLFVLSLDDSVTAREGNPSASLTLVPIVDDKSAGFVLWSRFGGDP